MKKWLYPTITLLLLGGLFVGYYYYSSRTTLPPRISSEPTPPEYPVTVIPLAAPVSDSDSELSGLAWYGDYLILLPQYPERFDKQLFALPKAEILSFLDGQLSGPLTPFPIPLNASNLSEEISWFEGFEAIGFVDEQVFVTIEAHSGYAMVGYLVSGTVAPDLSQVELESSTLVQIPAQSDISNASDETLLIADDRVMTIYEANGENVNSAPVVHQFKKNLTSLDEISFPNIEYRVTDATTLDAENRFWVINYLFPGSIDKLKPASDPLFTEYGVGSTHAEQETVERLLELHYSEAGITLTDRAPVQLELSEESRNWEGLARLDERGFLLVSDKFPETILGFVSYP